MEGFDRISQRPEIMGGKARIPGSRVTVGMVVGQIGAGRSIDAILADYPIFSAMTFCKLCATRRGGRKSVRSLWPENEVASK